MKNCIKRGSLIPILQLILLGSSDEEDAMFGAPKDGRDYRYVYIIREIQSEGSA
jgi:hypothetical protein